MLANCRGMSSEIVGSLASCQPRTCCPNSQEQAVAPGCTLHPLRRRRRPRWADGIPPAMGGHLMPSGAAAPLSQSKGPGIDIDPLYFTYPAGSLNVDVVVYGGESAAAAGLADLVAAVSLRAAGQAGLASSLAGCCCGAAQACAIGLRKRCHRRHPTAFGSLHSVGTVLLLVGAAPMLCTLHNLRPCCVATHRRPQASEQAIAQKGSFAIALSGGSLVKSLGALVGRQGVDFSKW